VDRLLYEKRRLDREEAEVETIIDQRISQAEETQRSLSEAMSRLRRVRRQKEQVKEETMKEASRLMDVVEEEDRRNNPGYDLGLSREEWEAMVAGDLSWPEVPILDPSNTSLEASGRP
jgi:septal ring factor EnvC (AmiA/AmiB activator)